MAGHGVALVPGTRWLAVPVALLCLAGTSSASTSEDSGRYVVVRENASGQDWLELRSLTGSGARALTPRPVPGEQRQEWNTAFSPDGSMLVFQRRTPAARKLLLIHLETGKLSTLLHLPSSAGWSTGNVVWAQDSRSLLVALSNLERRVSRVERVSVDGSRSTVSSRRLSDGWTVPQGTSPDGTQALIADVPLDEIYSQYEGPDVLYTMAGRTKIRLASTWALGGAEWSPDGRLVAYAANCYSLCRLEAVRPDGRGRRVLGRRARPDGGAYDFMSFAWGGRPGEIVYGTARTLFGVEARSGARRTIATLPCPRPCEQPVIDELWLSRDRTVAYVSLFDEIEGWWHYRVSLLDGAVRSAEHLRAADSIWFESGAGP